MSELVLAEFDDMFLEATRPVAEQLIEQHLQVKEKEDWLYPDLISDDLLARVEMRRQNAKPGDPPFLPLPKGIKDAFVLFLTTEDGIIYYPEDVGRIFNPHRNKPDDNDPHNVFGRRWPTEEYPHGIALRRAAQLVGLDMMEIERLRKAFGNTGIVPHPESTIEGLAYTSRQEADTAGPYERMEDWFEAYILHQEELTKASSRGVQELIMQGVLKPRVANQDTDAAETEDVELKPENDTARDSVLDPLELEAVEAIIKTLQAVGGDERLHRKYMARTVGAGIKYGNEQLRSAILVGLAKTNVNFQMPGEAIPQFVRRSATIRRLGIYTLNTSLKSEYQLTKRLWRVPKLSGLTPDGEQAQHVLMQRIEHFETNIMGEDKAA